MNKYDKNTGHKKIRLAGFTLAETMVYMIIAGLVFLMVMEGFTLFRKYTRLKTNAITNSNEVYNAYHRLAGEIGRADSAAYARPGGLMLFRDGELLSSVTLDERTLTVRKNGTNDTVFSNAISMNIIHAANSDQADTVNIVIKHTRDNKELNIRIPLIFDKRKHLMQNIENNERRYIYDEDQ